MYLMTFLRSTSMICVPLFILLSGYLLNRKKPERSYFHKIWKTLSIYFLARACCYFYARYFSANAPGTGSLRQFMLQTLSFQAAPYAWYINMYLGLFLLIPYLNLIFHGLSAKRERQGLILVLLLLTALPGILNSFSLSQGFEFVGSSQNTDPILPDYWKAIYPVTYYFLGAYLRWHPLPFKKRTAGLLLLASVLLNGLWNIAVCQGDYFPLGIWQDYEALPNVIVSVLFFHYFAGIDYSRLRPWCHKLLAGISDLSLGAFLVSWIFDDIFYGFLHRLQPEFHRQILYFPIAVLTICTCSLALAFLLNRIQMLLTKTIRTVSLSVHSK